MINPLRLMFSTNVGSNLEIAETSEHCCTLCQICDPHEICDPRPWDLPRHSIHHDTPSPFPNNVPIYELRAIAEDFHMLAVGGIESAIDPYKSCIVPSLVAKYSTWTEIEKGLMPHRVFSDVSSYMFRSLPPGWQLKLP